jgi:hypothetical protein
VTHVDVDERLIDFQIVGMPLPKNDRSQRPPLSSDFDLSNDLPRVLA